MRGLGAVVEVDHPAAEAALLQQLELEALASRQSPGPPAHDHRGKEEMALVDQPRRERGRGELRPADREIGRGIVLEGAYDVRIERALDSGARAARRLERAGVD